MERTRAYGGILFFPLLAFILALFFLPAGATLNGTETIITTGTTGSFQGNPAISGNVIAWDDQRAGGGMNIVYAYNLQTGTEYPVLPDPSNPYLWQTAPAVNGDWFVWQQDDYVSYSIVAYNNATLETIAIPAVPRNAADYLYLTEPSDNVLPKTNGTAVVWQDYTGDPHWGIYLYDLSQGSGGSADPILADPAFDQKSPDISGDYIVYENWSSGQSDIYLYFGANRTAVQISAFSNDDLNPAVDGMRIVWQRSNTTTGFDAVYRYDIATGETRQVTLPGSLFSQTRPKVSGDLVVVEDGRNATAPQLSAYNLATTPPTETWITPASEGMKKNPAISGNRVVWEDYRNGAGDDSDVYLNTLGPAEICPVADFTLTPSAVDPGDDVSFTAAGPQAGASAISHVLWNFSDGSPQLLSTGLTTTHQYASDGVYAVTLTVNNPKCRRVSEDSCRHQVFVNSPPVADFTMSPGYGLAPLTVRFTDTSCGAPRTWAWDFGDGQISSAKNPAHVYSVPSREYTISLTVNNTRAGSASSTATKKVRTFMGGQNTAILPVYGITADDRFGDTFLTYDSYAVPSYSPKPPAAYLTAHPHQVYGWDTITFRADSTGFGPAHTNITYFGTISRIFLRTRDAIATTSGTVPAIGNNWGANYLINTTAYPDKALQKTEVWEGATPPDRADFEYIALHATTPALIREIAYTANITKQNFTREGDEKINMSVGHSWASSAHRLYVVGKGIDNEGNKKGALIPARHLFQDGDLDYFEADIPEAAGFLSTFALADVEGSYNPFQLITLTIASHISPPSIESSQPSAPGSGSGTSAGGGGGAVRAAVSVITPMATSTPTAVPTDDPGTTAKIYTNGAGVVTQATRLRSNDGRALVSLGEGVVAKDAGGKPLSGITIRALPSGSLPAVPAGSAFTFAGMAYEISPDGTTFSPPVTLALTLPQAQWGKDYAVKSFDRASGSWQDEPTTFDANTGTVTVQVSHLCIFALFAEPRVSPVTTPAATPLPTLPVTPQVTAKPPTTAMSIFTNMIAWAVGVVVNNSILVVIVIVLAVAAVFLYRQRKFPGSGR